MSLSGRRRPFCPPSLALLLIISLLHVWFSGQVQVGAIRSFPHTLPAAKKNHTQIFREYFNGRISGLNTTKNELPHISINGNWGFGAHVILYSYTGLMCLGLTVAFATSFFFDVALP